MPKISPFLWFDTEAEEAAELYVSSFKNSCIESVARYGDAGPGPKGSVMTLGFKLEGSDFAALNGGPVFKFTPAVSFFVSLGTEEETDALWKKLSVSGKVRMELRKYPFSEKFGWVEDAFGVNWQLNLGAPRKSIAPMLMFCGAAQGRAEEAMNDYLPIFKGSKIDFIDRYESGWAAGKIRHARFTLGGSEFLAMDSGVEQDFTFTPAISFLVNCQTQDEIDLYWEKLSSGGRTSQCGWLEDRYGLSWQIVPRAQRATTAMLGMTKLNIAELKKAYAG